ncbi:hypothetical protein BGW36DRAFT_369463 [Talaromyces proteolyticus]|uniref:Uncharacterized protein n=1 Tax=Talaromyces proteolyticus TaxID=1131652 RepID=A0AAD4PZY7_9EURO|nr:uncharacterized protein BGW36DRAFT_369463 [Talaromyces proteolyticus]KAH8703518.1 hypothetical protein BGW36DRAFT_369463 [Talaromyces proteolyticus]
MSGPYRAYPGNGNQPFSSGSQANQPVSFKTDINRKKTKKWVSAKSVSYDGDDWGRNPPLPTDASRFSANQQQSSSNFQPNQPASIPVATSQPTNPPESKKSEPASTQTPAFVRPADIYKRMQEEREKERFSEDSSRSGSLPPTAAPPSAPSPLAIAQDSHEGVTTLRGENVEPSTSSLVIPELKRLSGFGQDFLGSSAYSEQTSQPVQAALQQGQAEDLPLHHNPSLGFRSVVNQAFDVPETPTSSNGNFSRSNSDSTSVISPIISRTNVESEKTPTITEDIAGEASAQGPPADFRPGHRRDLSIPAPGNGPDRVPEVSNVEPSHSAEVVSPALSGNNLSAPDTDTVESSVSKDQPESGEATPHLSSVPHASIENPSLYTAPVENLNGPQKEQLQQREPTPLEIPQSKSQEIPQIVPSMSTETSPQDMESDRLRKEIMRSLSPDPTSASASPNPETIDFRKSQYRPGHESTYLPSEYDSYWNDQKDVTPTSPLQPKPTTTTPASVPSTEPLSLTINPKAVSETVSKEPETDSAVSETQRTLKKRFSWEATDDSDEEDVLEEQSEKTPIAPTVQSPSSSKNAQFTAPAAFGDDVTRDTALQDEIGAFDDHGLPRYSTIARETTQPPEEPAVEIAGPIRESSSIPTQEAPALGSQTVTPIESPKQPTHPLGAEASLPSFRKIMDIQSPSEKQFALIDNGLEDWIRRSNLIRLNGQLPGGAPTGFPKLTSLGNLSLPSSHSHGDGLGYSPSHARRPSGSPLTGGMNRQNVESKGKDLLHSAGVLARGLFAKGKNKLRGGADKVD